MSHVTFLYMYMYTKIADRMLSFPSLLIKNNAFFRQSNVMYICTMTVNRPLIPFPWFPWRRSHLLTSRTLRFCTFTVADAGWESFADKKEVSSANQEHMIQKVLQNIHWERKPRGRGTDEQDDRDSTRTRHDDDSDVSNHHDNNKDDDECHSRIDNCIDLDNFDDDSQYRGRATSSQIASQVRTVDRNKGGNRKLCSSMTMSAVFWNSCCTYRWLVYCTSRIIWLYKFTTFFEVICINFYCYTLLFLFCYP